ncbi:MaoC/PaaZ C-terminal domain-containing protein [Mycobacterium sp. 236(2023)]|uniref:MaoC/PaaZ C-terminal domain-containing protein n=1 Tax=Mycobacterium sp. 236(2023) TaxID=3038163 RepID=UPI0024150888|nr:MaoC/PaaZ C-terminal domain-containing protein [Mycobacterium sp. 236(2023)]MDG4668078.1 MaoC/PaaZ C-terminal domain-containing protein [Mycobacterium sp. 236(2023)]
MRRALDGQAHEYDVMQAKYLEDLAVGDTFTGPARTITETDVVGFAGLSGDFNPIHTDVEFAADTPYGQRVVYGLLVLSMMTGQLDRTGLFSGSAIAMLGIRDWTFVAPVFIGDTVSFRLTITEVRRTSRGDRGVVGRHFEILNQRGEVVQRGHIDVMVRAASAQVGL